MPVQSINQQAQQVPQQQKNINLSPAEFSKLLESLKNPQKNTPEATTSDSKIPSETGSREESANTAPVRKPINHPPIKSYISRKRELINNQTNEAPAVVKTNTTPQSNPLDETIVQNTSPPTMSPSSNPPENIVSLGEISEENPTVSQLLRSNSKYKKDAWNIIFSDINKTKEFNRIRKGTTISIDTATNELVWKGSPPRNQAIPIPTNITPENITKDGQIIIGEISKNSPTVSHLLRGNSFYKDYTWKIIFSDTNKNKPYASLTPGKVVTIDPKTYELFFLDKKDVPDSKPLSASAAKTLNSFATDYFNQHKDFSERLADSVKNYIGTPYEKIDCYSLLVKGMQNQGVNYTGSGGVRERMEKLAMEQGLPLNAYQNGEGLIETSGIKIYGKSYVNIDDAIKQSSEIFSEIKPILKEGEILSFSTPSRGHTGIISSKNDNWTYINSGIIDNQVDAGATGRRVGEESLKDELENWFVLAKNQNESLKISIGMLDESKLNIGKRLVAQTDI